MGRTGEARADFAGTKRFEIISRVGEGAVGVVYEAIDRERRMRVALKTLRNPSPETLLLLKNEFRSMQDIQHRNLVQLGELFEEDGRWFFTMEFVDGVDFLSFVRKGSTLAAVDAQVARPILRFDERRLRSALAQIARGISALHEAHKVHRDIKPSNVLVTSEGRVVVLDFGVMSDLANAREREAETGSVVGTAAYMAPEQAGGEELGPAADWYALGTMLYQALTGQLPYGGSVQQMLQAKLTTAAPLPQSVAPGLPTDLCDLCAALLSLEPKARPTGKDVLLRLRALPSGDKSSPSQGTIFVGRQHELSILESALPNRGERATTIVLRGASGVGKTHLAKHFLDQLRQTRPEILILSGRCYERESVPYKGIDSIVDDLSLVMHELTESETKSILPRHAHLIAKAFPVLRELPLFAPPAGNDDDGLVPQEMRLRLFSALRELFNRVARRFSLVVVIDDFQWADPDSQALVAALLAPPDPPPMLLVMTMRVATEVRLRRAGVELPGNVRYVDVEQLPQEDAEQLAARLLGNPDENAVRDIVAEAKGHPLFIDELTRRTRSEGKALRLDDALWARISGLEPHLRKVVELLSVAGLPITQSVAASAASLDAGQLFDALTVLRAGKLVRSEGTGRQDDVAPYHDRVRESVVAHLDDATKKHWHGRLAVALEAENVRDFEMLATHWEGAEQSERAAGYAAQAADESARALAFDRAARLYQLALSLKPLTGAEGNALKRSLADALINAGRGAEAAAVLLDAARSAEPLVAIDLRRIAAEQFLISGNFDEGLRTLAEVMRDVDLRFPKTPLAALVMMIFYRIVLALRGFSFQARPPSDMDPRECLRVDVSWSAGHGLRMNDTMRGICLQTVNSLHALRLGDKNRILRAFAMEALSGGAVNRKLSERLLAQAKELASQVGTPYADAIVRVCEGGMAYFWGEWVRAVPLLLEAEETFRDRCLGTQFELNSARLMLYRCLSSRGMLNELAEHALPIERDADKRRDRYALNTVRTIPLMTLGLARDDTKSVEHHLDLADADLPPGKLLVQHYLCIIARGQLDLYRGHPGAAYERNARNARALAKSLILRVAICRISVTDQRARSAIAAAFAHPFRREELLADAEKQTAALLRERDAWGRALGTLASACLLAVKGDRGGAIGGMRSAVTAFESCGMEFHAAATQLRLGQWLGGGEGASLVSEGRERMRTRGVAMPERLADAHVPSIILERRP